MSDSLHNHYKECSDYVAICGFLLYSGHGKYQNGINKINLHIVHLDACYIYASFSHGDAGLSSYGLFISIVLKWVDLHFSYFLSFLITV